MLLRCPGKKHFFQGIAREIRNFFENNHFRINFFVSTIFVSEGSWETARRGGKTYRANLGRETYQF